MADIKLTYFGSVKDGKIVLPGKKLREELPKFFEGKNIMLTVERRKKRRSVEQNRYYWGVVLNILCHSLKEYNGEMELTTDIVHEWCKDRFIPLVSDWEEIILQVPDGQKEVVKTSTKLTTVQFMDYIALIQQWAAEYNIYIPDPNEFEFESVDVDVDKI
jgi:hypothetical protein